MIKSNYCSKKFLLPLMALGAFGIVALIPPQDAKASLVNTVILSQTNEFWNIDGNNSLISTSYGYENLSFQHGYAFNGLTSAQVSYSGLVKYVTVTYKYRTW